MATGSWVRSAASGINTHQEGFAHLDGDERLSFLDIQPDAVAFREESLAPTASEDLAALELLESAAQTLPAPGYQSSLHTLHFPDSGQPTGQLVDVPRWDPVEMPSASQNQAASLATAPGRALHAEPTLPEHVSQMTIQEFLNCSPSAQERARRESTILGWMPPGAPLPLPAPPSELTGSYHANSNAPRLSHSGPPNPLYASEQAGLASALPPQQLGTWPTGGGQAATTGYAAADLNTAQYMQVSAERQETPVRQWTVPTQLTPGSGRSTNVTSNQSILDVFHQQLPFNPPESQFSTLEAVGVIISPGTSPELQPRSACSRFHTGTTATNFTTAAAATADATATTADVTSAFPPFYGGLPVESYPAHTAVYADTRPAEGHFLRQALETVPTQLTPGSGRANNSISNRCMTDMLHSQPPFNLPGPPFSTLEADGTIITPETSPETQLRSACSQHNTGTTATNFTAATTAAAGATATIADVTSGGLQVESYPALPAVHADARSAEGRFFRRALDSAPAIRSDAGEVQWMDTSDGSSTVVDGANQHLLAGHGQSSSNDEGCPSGGSVDSTATEVALGRAHGAESLSACLEMPVPEQVPEQPRRQRPPLLSPVSPADIPLCDEDELTVDPGVGIFGGPSRAMSHMTIKDRKGRTFPCPCPLGQRCDLYLVLLDEGTHFWKHPETGHVTFFRTDAHGNEILVHPRKGLLLVGSLEDNERTPIPFDCAHHKGQKSMKTILIIQSSCRQVLVRLRKEFTWVMKKRGSKSTEGGPGPGPGPDARRKGPNRHAGGAGKARGRPRGGSRASGQFKSTGKSLIAQQRAIGPCEVVYAYQSTQLRSHVCPYCTVPVDEQGERIKWRPEEEYQMSSSLGDLSSESGDDDLAQALTAYYNENKNDYLRGSSSSELACLLCLESATQSSPVRLLSESLNGTGAMTGGDGETGQNLLKHNDAELCFLSLWPTVQATHLHQQQASVSGVVHFYLSFCDASPIQTFLSQWKGPVAVIAILSNSRASCHKIFSDLCDGQKTTSPFSTPSISAECDSDDEQETDAMALYASFHATPSCMIVQLSLPSTSPGVCDLTRRGSFGLVAALSISNLIIVESSKSCDEVQLWLAAELERNKDRVSLLCENTTPQFFSAHLAVVRPRHGLSTVQAGPESLHQPATLDSGIGCEVLYPALRNVVKDISCHGTTMSLLPVSSHGTFGNGSDVHHSLAASLVIASSGATAGRQETDAIPDYSRVKKCVSDLAEGMDTLDAIPDWLAESDCDPTLVCLLAVAVCQGRSVEQHITIVQKILSTIVESSKEYWREKRPSDLLKTVKSSLLGHITACRQFLEERGKQIGGTSEQLQQACQELIRVRCMPSQWHLCSETHSDSSAAGRGKCRQARCHFGCILPAGHHRTCDCASHHLTCSQACWTCESFELAEVGRCHKPTGHPSARHVCLTHSGMPPPLSRFRFSGETATPDGAGASNSSNLMAECQPTTALMPPPPPPAPVSSISGGWTGDIASNPVKLALTEPSLQQRAPASANTTRPLPPSIWNGMEGSPGGELDAWRDADYQSTVDLVISWLHKSHTEGFRHMPSLFESGKELEPSDVSANLVELQNEHLPQKVEDYQFASKEKTINSLLNGSKPKKVSLGDLFPSAQNILVISGPGIGKTAIFRYKAPAEFAQELLWPELDIVLAFELRCRRVQQASDWKDLLNIQLENMLDELPDDHQRAIHMAVDYIQHHMPSVGIILDGLDECYLSKCSPFMQTMIHNPESNLNLIVTCRPCGEASKLKRSGQYKRFVEVVGFTPEEVDHFICRRMSDEAGKEELRNLIASKPEINALMCYPVFVMVASELQSEGLIPHSSTHLFEGLVELKKAKSMARMHGTEDKEKKLARALQLLQTFAMHMLAAQKLIFTDSDLDYHQLPAEARSMDLLITCTAGDGRGGQQWRFGHLMIQEFLAARDAAHSVRDGIPSASLVHDFGTGHGHLMMFWKFVIAQLPKEEADSALAAMLVPHTAQQSARNRYGDGGYLCNGAVLTEIVVQLLKICDAEGYNVDAALRHLAGHDRDDTRRSGSKDPWMRDRQLRAARQLQDEVERMCEEHPDVYGHLSELMAGRDALLNILVTSCDEKSGRPILLSEADIPHDPTAQASAARVPIEISGIDPHLIKRAREESEGLMKALKAWVQLESNHSTTRLREVLVKECPNANGLCAFLESPFSQSNTPYDNGLNDPKHEYAEQGDGNDNYDLVMLMCRSFHEHVLYHNRDATLHKSEPVEALLHRFHLDVPMKSIPLCDYRAMTTAISHHPSALRKLDVSLCGMTDAGLEQLLPGIKECTSLEALHLSDNSLTTRHLENLSDCLEHSSTSLQYFSIARNNFEDRGLEMIIPGLQTCTQLRGLWLNKTGITAASTAALAATMQCMPHLNTLWLNDNTLGDEALGEISEGLKAVSTLTEVNLGSAGLTSSSLPAISALLRPNSNMEILRLGGHNTFMDGDPESERQLIQSVKLAKLKELTVPAKSAISTTLYADLTSVRGGHCKASRREVKFQ